MRIVFPVLLLAALALSAKLPARSETSTLPTFTIRAVKAGNGGAVALDKATQYLAQLRQALVRRLKAKKEIAFTGEAAARYGIGVNISVHDQSFIAAWQIVQSDSAAVVSSDVLEYNDTPEPEQLADVLAGQVVRFAYR